MADGDRWGDGIDRMLHRIEDTARRVEGRYPHWADPETGDWVTTADGDWTGGYWMGMLWLAERTTGDRRYGEWAAALLAGLRARVDADTVFKSFPTYYGAALGAIVGGRADARAVALDCAARLVELFDPGLGLIPLGRAAEEGSSVGTTETSIDSLQAAPFLFWAARESGDRTMHEVARSHAERVIALHRRDDGSFIQSTSLDPATGEVVRHYTHKGYSDTSTWGRAQAWGVLFSTMSHLAAGEPRWLGAAGAGADWWAAHVPTDRVAFWDFDDPAIPDTERDTAATAIAAAALLKLAAVVPADAQRRYRDEAELTVAALLDGYLTPTGPGDRRPPGILTGSCFNKRPDARPEDAAARCEFIVAEYYLFEALHVLAGHVDATAL
jgi:unsaturated chondroitin disaccharide hydrolase